MKHGMTPGVKNALSRGSVHSMCNDCGFPLPRYPGRYPKSCPSCGEERHPETPHESFEEAFELAPGFVPDVGDFVALDERTATVVYVNEDAAYLEFDNGEELALPLR